MRSADVSLTAEQTLAIPQLIEGSTEGAEIPLSGGEGVGFLSSPFAGKRPLVCCAPGALSRARSCWGNLTPLPAGTPSIPPSHLSPGTPIEKPGETARGGITPAVAAAAAAVPVGAEDRVKLEASGSIVLCDFGSQSPPAPDSFLAGAPPVAASTAAAIFGTGGANRRQR